ncbi:MAG: hypothetical protein K6E76_04410 [Patescibacteria group bacterium]|nr:hypothetical protein [Patescibacteria group bacterium]
MSSGVFVQTSGFSVLLFFSSTFVSILFFSSAFAEALSAGPSGIQISR